MPEEKAPTEAESFVSGVETAAVEEIREERKIIEAAPERPQEIPLLSAAGREDDWFVLLDVVPRETSYIPPGTILLSSAPLLCSTKRKNVKNFAAVFLLASSVPSIVSEDLFFSSPSCCFTSFLRRDRRICLGG